MPTWEPASYRLVLPLVLHIYLLFFLSRDPMKDMTASYVIVDIRDLCGHHSHQPRYGHHSHQRLYGRHKHKLKWTAQSLEPLWA